MLCEVWFGKGWATSQAHFAYDSSCTSFLLESVIWYARRWDIDKMLHGAEIGAPSFELTGWWGELGKGPHRCLKWTVTDENKTKEKKMAQLLSPQAETGIDISSRV